MALPAPHESLTRAWAHPGGHVVFTTLSAAQTTFPGIRHFKRIWTGHGPVQLSRFASGNGPTIVPRARGRYRLVAEQQATEDLAQAILTEHLSETPHGRPAIGLWPSAHERVCNLAASQAVETALARACYVLLLKLDSVIETASIVDAANLIVERHQEAAGIRPAAALWPRILDDVHALNLDQRTETDLARACYGLLFLVPIAD